MKFVSFSCLSFKQYGIEERASRTVVVYLDDTNPTDTPLAPPLPLYPSHHHPVPHSNRNV